MEEERPESQISEQQQPAENNESATEQKQEEKHKSHKGRIIIRNLVFDINEKHVRKLTNKFGELIDVNLPINPATNKAKGFAFVEFDNKNIALKAIKELNGIKFKGRTIAVDLAVDKTRFESHKNSIKQEDKKKNENKNKSFEDGDDEEINEGEDEDEEGEEEEGSEIEEEEDIDDDEEELEGEENEVEEEEEEEESQNEDFSCTIFVRNISYDVGQSEFRDFFRQIGPIEYAKLVINRETETHNGTGFVKFKSSEKAQYLVEQSKKQEESNPFKKDGMVYTEVNLELGGRRMIILPAMGKKDVKKLKESRDKKFEENAPKNKNTLEYWIYQDKHKKRNLFLTKFGLNDPEEVPESEKEKFTANLNEKIEKAKNPNYFVSKTRVIFKNLPKRDFDEDDLKKVILEVLSEKHNAKIIKTRRLVAKTIIIREKDRVTEDGNLRSRGYGFTEFVNHEDALYFLEQIKEKYNLISEVKVPIVEFAIEDFRELKKKEKILQKIKGKAEQQKKEETPKPKKVDAEKKNAEQLAKMKIEKLLEEGNKHSLSEIKGLLKKIQSRGIKQRLKKRVAYKFNLEKQEKNKENTPKPSMSKLQTKVERKQKEKVERENRNESTVRPERPQKKAEPKKNFESLGEDLGLNGEDEAQLIKGLQKIIKNNKKMKRRAEDHDDFDEIAEAYKKKVQKI